MNYEMMRLFVGAMMTTICIVVHYGYSNSCDGA